MKIGIIGAGHVGGSAALLFANSGHQVALSNSRGPASLASLVAEIGVNARALSTDDAASFGEVVFLAVPWRNPEALPSPKTTTGKIVIDAMNQYKQGGGLQDLGDGTASEVVAERLPGARIVKAFNTMHYETLRTAGRPAGTDRLVIFLAGDDARAKETVAALIDGIGFDTVDTGSLRDGGRRQEPGSPIYNKPLTIDQARAILASMA
ncbi:MAG: NADPH-dependent F420 reductase [Chloroflexi bacterium]|nr:NADPH-dependent F420 reductase [Chloroflexota bacterium]